MIGYFCKTRLLMTTKVEIKFKDRPKALRFKKHLEKTHPSTRGNIKIECGAKMKNKSKFKFNQVSKAKRVTKI